MKIIQNAPILNMFWKKSTYNRTYQLSDTFHGRISVLIELYNNSKASKKSLQNIINKELYRIKEINNGRIPYEIKILIVENGLKL